MPSFTKPMLSALQNLEIITGISSAIIGEMAQTVLLNANYDFDLAIAEAFKQEFHALAESDLAMAIIWGRVQQTLVPFFSQLRH